MTLIKQVGSLAALHLAKKGHDVHLYEYREGESYFLFDYPHFRMITLLISFQIQISD